MDLEGNFLHPVDTGMKGTFCFCFSLGIFFFLASNHFPLSTATSIRLSRLAAMQIDTLKHIRRGN
jgi:hypothetical protein